MLVEPLESRRLFDAFVDANHVLQVTGTTGNDKIFLTLVSPTSIEVTINGGIAVSFDPAALTGGYHVSASAGDDIVVVSAALDGSIEGGDGNDRLVGGGGNETLVGGAGKDVLDGGLGNDRLNGNGGNDKLFGNAGGDRLYGYDGNDYLDGGSSNDRLYGGAGADTSLGQSGNDNFFAFDHEKDEIYGGTGKDTAVCDGIDIRGSVEQIALV